jgi:acyl-CoA synthetase (AMP-forming)/AMP-acid ligase II
MHGPWYTLRPYPEFPLFEFLRLAAAKHPSRPALLTPDGEEWTFSAVDEGARRVAGLLTPSVRRGDRVLFMAPNSPAYATAIYGTMMAGAIAVPVNPLSKPDELRRALTDTEPAAAFASADATLLINSLRGEAPSLRSVHLLDNLWRELEGTRGVTPVDLEARNDIAALPFSSGTTGVPKGVMLTHFNLVANVRQTLATGMTPAYSTLLNYLPFFHVYGFASVMGMAFAMGVAQVIIPRFDPELVLRLASQHNVQTLYAPPPALRALVAVRGAGAPLVPSLRVIITGAAPTPPDLAAAAEDAFGAPVCQPYGLSEATAATNINLLSRNKPGTVGPPLPDTEEKIVDPESGAELDAGSVGEVWVRGPQVMRGYWRRPDATAQCLTQDGWLRTGDLGRLDEDGYLQIVDRLKDMIRYKGHQVAPFELEAILLEHPAVADACVIPKADVEAGEIPKACVVLKPGALVTGEELQALVAGRVNPMSRVREIEFIEAIPRNPSGKVLRRELVARERAKPAART